MLPGPGDVGDGTADAALVFVSYSHADAVWAQRFRVFLKPLVRAQTADSLGRTPEIRGDRGVAPGDRGRDRP